MKSPHVVEIENGSRRSPPRFGKRLARRPRALPLPRSRPAHHPVGLCSVGWMSVVGRLCWSVDAPGCNRLKYMGRPRPLRPTRTPTVRPLPWSQPTGSARLWDQRSAA